MRTKIVHDAKTCGKLTFLQGFGLGLCVLFIVDDSRHKKAVTIEQDDWTIDCATVYGAKDLLSHVGPSKSNVMVLRSHMCKQRTTKVERT